MGRASGSGGGEYTGVTRARGRAFGTGIGFEGGIKSRRAAHTGL